MNTSTWKRAWFILYNMLKLAGYQLEFSIINLFVETKRRLFFIHFPLFFLLIFLSFFFGYQLQSILILNTEEYMILKRNYGFS